MKLISATITKWNGQDMGGATMALNTESIVYAVDNEDGAAEVTYYDLAFSARPIKVLLQNLAIEDFASQSKQLLKVSVSHKGASSALSLPANSSILINLDRIILMTGLDAGGGADVGSPVYEMTYDESRTNCTGIDSPFAMTWKVTTDMEDEGENMVGLVGNVDTAGENGVAVNSMSINGIDVDYEAGTLAWFSTKRVATAFDVDSKAVVKFKGDKVGFSYLKTNISLANLIAASADVDTL
ncbi:hypothetical protein H8D85_01340 [bacterium]|nr:hypothetical protein [bacterium]